MSDLLLGNSEHGPKRRPLAPRRYVAYVEKIEVCIVEVVAANAREAKKLARDENNWVENHGWDGMHSSLGRVISVRRDQ